MRQRYLRFFLSCISGATLEDLALLHRLPSLPNVQIFDAATDSVVEFEDDLWPVKWLLVRYHRKHIFASQRLPTHEEFVKSVSDFTNKFHWAHHHKSLNHIHEPLPPKLRTPGVPTPPCSKPLHPCFAAWTGQLRRCLAQGFLRDEAVARATPRKEMPVIRRARKMLRALGLTAVPRDRGGGFTLVRDQDLQAAAFKILGGSCYHYFSGIVDLNGMRETYCRLIKRISKECDVLEGRCVGKSLSLPRGTAAGTLAFTIKDHKAPGEVCFRNLHTGSRSLWQGLGRWVTYHLSPILSSQPHVLQSQQAFVNLCAGLTLHDDDFFFRIDACEFYMSGTPEFLSKEASGVIQNPKLRSVVRDSIAWLLENQYVTTPFHNAGHWQVLKGSGMGMVHSGDVAGSAFLHAIERPFACSPTCQREHYIKTWVRYHDDIFGVCSSRPAFRKFYQELKTRCSPHWKLRLEEMSPDAVSMIGIKVIRLGCKVVTEVEPKANGPVLSSQSAHAPAIHRRWPANRAMAIENLCTAPGSVERSISEFVARFTDAAAPDHIIRDIVHREPSKRVCAVGEPFWLVLPYHPAFENGGVRRALASFLKSPAAATLWREATNGGAFPAVRIAWRNSLAHHVHSINRG